MYSSELLPLERHTTKGIPNALISSPITLVHNNITVNWFLDMFVLAIGFSKTELLFICLSIIDAP